MVDLESLQKELKTRGTGRASQRNALLGRVRRVMTPLDVPPSTRSVCRFRNWQCSWSWLRWRRISR